MTNSTKVAFIGKIKIILEINDNIKMPIIVEVMDKNREELILRNDILGKKDSVIDFENKEVRIIDRTRESISTVKKDIQIKKMNTRVNMKKNKSKNCLVLLKRSKIESFGFKGKETIKKQSDENKFEKKMDIGEMSNEKKNKLKIY
ncbi:hypothetical protein RCL_jg22266.t1 [Rhizophagus clarus]|uniref:Uncharacterized protein n=1 Tax=Rhizophagus clarus TaxID=94130 RepID=A0A8H3LI01_9GLOM|nr:hypothetical protein RCL_jg22266.t1 [Rhizophagus clarus]